MTFDPPLTTSFHSLLFIVLTPFYSVSCIHVPFRAFGEHWASLNTTFMGHFLKCCSVDKHNFNNLSWTKVLVEKYSLDRYSTNVLGVVWVNNVDMLRRCIWICMRYLRTQYLCVLNIYVSRYRMCTMDWCWGSFSPYNILQYYSQGKHLSLCVLHSRDSVQRSGCGGCSVVLQKVPSEGS